MEDQEKATMKADIMTMLSNVIKNCSDEQIKLITANPVMQAFAFQVLSEFQIKNISNCIRFFGNLFAMDEQACTHYVKQPEFMAKIRNIFTYCTKIIRKEALWLVSNIAANSEAEAVLIAKD